MLPKVNAANRHALHVNHAMHERVVFVVRLGDQKAAILTDTKPHPAG